MATEAYITLANSDASLTKRFKVLVDGFALFEERSDNVRKTVEGNLDVSSGHIYGRYEYVFRVRGAEVDDDYGDIDDLRTFWGYNSPTGTPSRIIDLVDHVGEEHAIVMVGTFQRSPLTVVLDGADAVWNIKATLLIVG